jgi:hypothetical protein
VAISIHHCSIRYIFIAFLLLIILNIETLSSDAHRWRSSSELYPLHVQTISTRLVRSHQTQHRNLLDAQSERHPLRQNKQLLGVLIALCIQMESKQ